MSQNSLFKIHFQNIHNLIVDESETPLGKQL